MGAPIRLDEIPAPAAVEDQVNIEIPEALRDAAIRRLDELGWSMSSDPGDKCGECKNFVASVRFIYLTRLKNPKTKVLATVTWDRKLWEGNSEIDFRPLVTGGLRASVSQHCPLCGASGWAGAALFHCDNESCRNH